MDSSLSNDFPPTLLKCSSLPLSNRKQMKISHECSSQPQSTHKQNEKKFTFDTNIDSDQDMLELQSEINKSWMLNTSKNIKHELLFNTNTNNSSFSFTTEDEYEDEKEIYAQSFQKRSTSQVFIHNTYDS